MNPLYDTSFFDKPEKTLARFWAKVQKTDSCWIWTASKRNKGYGAFCWWQNGKQVQGRAHVFAFRLIVGDTKGLFVLHRCDNPACVNPEHLFLGTNQDNVDDMMQKGRHAHTYLSGDKSAGKWKRGLNHWNAKLDEHKVREIRQLYALGSWSETMLADRFHVRQGTIHHVLAKNTWAWVE